MVLCGLVALFVVGCATPQKKGDRAFERGQYQSALEHYEESIDKGTEDWRVYYRAAQAANHGAKFAAAERYYSKALRYGGGTKVAREFAAFYLKTSNYAKAARLLQYLLNTDIEKQPVYNNLGTALMYAGAPLDAESYLLIAQQMDPKDPIPYINLGVLYERHFHKPSLALGFYRCYAKLSKGSSQSEKVRTRIAQLGNQLRGAGAVDVPCGEPYRPGRGVRAGSASREELRKSLEGRGGGEGRERPVGESGQREETAQSGNKTIDLQFDGAAGDEEAQREEGKKVAAELEKMEEESGEESRGDSGGESDSAEDVIIERQGERPSAVASPGGDERQEADGADEAEERAARDANQTRLERARQAFEQENHKLVVEIISDMSLGQLEADSMRIYGVSLAELGRNEEAAQWLEWSVKRKPSAGAVSRLLEVYERLERQEDIRGLCERLKNRSSLEESVREALEACPSPMDTMTPEQKQKALEEYRKQQ